MVEQTEFHSYSLLNMFALQPNLSLFLITADKKIVGFLSILLQ